MTDARQYFKALFERAKCQGGITYIYSLVRVTGITCNLPDPILELRYFLQSEQPRQSDGDILYNYCYLVKSEEPLSLLANLMNCALSRPFSSYPFHHLREGDLFFPKNPSISAVVQEIKQKASAEEFAELKELLDMAFPSEIVNLCMAEPSAVDPAQLKIAYANLREFLSGLLDAYFAARLAFNEQTRFHKLAKFEVLELLTDDDFGLFGFHLHFSNGSSATFSRGVDSTECNNIRPGSPLEFSVGWIDQLRDEWRVGEKRLCEIGLEGRYNKLGEWKPIVYPGKCDALRQEAYSLSNDHDISGTLFYMMCTGYRGIEFVVKTNIEFPQEFLTLAGKVQLWRCPALENDKNPDKNVWLYDGWYELDSADPDVIQHALSLIAVGLNIMAFSYEAEVKWRVKYRLTHGPGLYAAPSKEDLTKLDSMLRKFPQTEDADYLHIAVDWYNQGTAARNPFISFICYFMALESVAVAVADGKADFNLGYSKRKKCEIKQDKINCIISKHDELFMEDPIRFVQESYFDCIVGIKNKTKIVAGLVFGPNHKYVSLLFERSEEVPSLSDIRGSIAHGRVSGLIRNDRELARKRLPEIADISKAFLTRLIFQLRPEDEMPDWSGRHRSVMILSDPRSTSAVTSEQILPNQDWRIRPEWCD